MVADRQQWSSGGKLLRVENRLVSRITDSLLSSLVWFPFVVPWRIGSCSVSHQGHNNQGLGRPHLTEGLGLGLLAKGDLASHSRVAMCGNTTQKVALECNLGGGFVRDRSSRLASTDAAMSYASP
jgi:hypothetical protein